jgi:hypothetical protein
VTDASNPFANGDLVRFGTGEGVLPPEINADTRYKISDRTSGNYKIKDESGSTYINFSTNGTGTIRIWKADAGFDDPDQGLPTFCPEVNTTFSNIAYIEFKLPSGVSSPTDPPDWEDFRIIGTGRRLMDYDDTGAELGVITVADDLSNLALEVVDNALNNYKVNPLRIDWPSWKTFRDDCDTLIWQRIPPGSDDTPIAGSWSARYYSDVFFTDLVVTTSEATINFSGLGSGAGPAPGVAGQPFSAIFTANIIPLYTELYTLSSPGIDDTIELRIDGVLVMSGSTPSSPSVNFSMVAGQSYAFEVRWQQSGVGGSNPYLIQLKWQSASQALEIIPATAASPTDVQVKRYECHTAFPTATDCAEVHERLMERAPGWDWTDDDGLIKFLPPDRPVVFAFVFDKLDDDSRANFVKDTFQKKRRAITDRKNFLLFRYRDVLKDGFPFVFVQADRPALRDLTNGEPTNDPASDLGVSTRSLAERMGEMEMVLKTDPTHTINVSGSRPSSKLRKNQFVHMSYFDVDGNFVADAKYMVTFRSWGSKDSRNDFSLLPIPDIFYSDEPV